MPSPSPARHEIVRSLLRVLASFLLVAALYALWPLQGDPPLPIWVFLAMAVLVVLVGFGFQVRSVVRSPRPAARAVEALATSIPLMLVAFAAGYVAMSETSPDAFNEPLSKVSGLYFSITVFATVGFGDIAPVSETARVVVSAQMLLNFVVLGLGIRIVQGAVRIGKERNDGGLDDEAS